MLFNAEFPINALSFGHMSFGILYEFYKRGLNPCLFPIGQPDLGVYDKCGVEFHQYVSNCLNRANKHYKKNLPYLKLWHCQGAQHKVSEPSYLLTFHETSELTDTEVNILNSYNGIFLTSSYSKKVFENSGVRTPIHLVKLGFDSLHYHKTNKRYYDDDSITFAIYGKAEELRKAHVKTIQLWVSKFGNDKRYRLHLFLHNPFLQPQDLNNFYGKCFNGQKPPFNVTIYSFQNNDSLMNDCFNAADIVIDMSRGESLSLPSMVSVALGKHALLHNATGIKDWATEDNAVLVQSSGRIIADDGIFFKNGSDVNQGSFFDWKDQDFIDGLDKVIERFKSNRVNNAGLQLQKDYSFENGVNTILKVLDPS